MAIRKIKPNTPGQRGMTVIAYKNYITRTKPLKALTVGKNQTGGRNNTGRMTAPHRGGGHKRNYRLIDFKYNKIDIPAKLETIEYDPNRSGFVGIALFADGERRYVLVPKSMQVGQSFIVSETAKAETGNRLPLSKVPVGTFVFNIELKPLKGSALVRSAGSFAEVVAQDPDTGMTQIKLPSGEIRKVQSTCWATVGEVSNDMYRLVNLGKAGRSRYRGIRPHVRGSAMNPVDHPHGGGEQKQGIGLRRGPKTRYGKQAYGVKTRTPKKYSNNMIVTRRKTKRNTPK
jgi:large subunit ribosomal protein L2